MFKAQNKAQSNAVPKMKKGMKEPKARSSSIKQGTGRFRGDVEAGNISGREKEKRKHGGGGKRR